MQLVLTDGGRLAAGFKGDANDCVCRAIAIAGGLDYRTVYNRIGELSKTTARNRQAKTDTAKVITAILGWKWTPTMQIGQGCKVHLRADELPTGRLIVSVSRHVTAVINGIVYDDHDPRRDGTRCVYGYWKG